MADFVLPAPQPPPALPSDPSPIHGVIMPPPPVRAPTLTTAATDDELKQSIANSLAVLEIDPNATKAALIQSLSLAIENGDVALLDEPVQTSELLAYEVQRLPSGLLRYGAPAGQHDDTVMALAIAWAAANTETQTTRSSYAFSR